MEVAGDQRGATEKPGVGPPVAVEDPDPSDDRAGGRVDHDLAGQVPHEPDVVVAEDDLGRETGIEQRREDVEDDRPQPRREPYDGVLHVAGDDQPAGSGPDAEHPERFRKFRGRGTGGAERRVGVRAEAEVQVSDDENRAPPAGPQDERGGSLQRLDRRRAGHPEVSVAPTKSLPRLPTGAGPEAPLEGAEGGGRHFRETYHFL